MSRYTPVDELMLAIHELMLAIHEQVTAARATRDRPLTRGQINASRKACGAIVGQALNRLVDGGLLATMRLTRDNTTNDIYWPTGLKPITPPTDEELQKMSEPKSSRLKRLIILHGPINRDELVTRANADGMTSITKTNLRPMLQTAINAGEIIVGKDGPINLFMTPSQAEALAAPVAQASSLPPAETELPANHRAAFEKRIIDLEARINEIDHERVLLDDVVNTLYGALGVNTAMRAMDEITRLKTIEPTTAIGYLALPDYQDITIHPDQAGARAEVTDLLNHDNADSNATAFVVAVLAKATSSRSIEWQEA